MLFLEPNRVVVKVVGRLQVHAGRQNLLKINKNCVLEESKNLLWPHCLGSLEDSRVFKSQVRRAPGCEKCINFVASFAVQLPTGTIIGTFEFLQSCADICDIHSSIQLTDQSSQASPLTTVSRCPNHIKSHSCL